MLGAAMRSRFTLASLAHSPLPILQGTTSSSWTMRRHGTTSPWPGPCGECQSASDPGTSLAKRPAPNPACLASPPAVVTVQFLHGYTSRWGHQPEDKGMKTG